MAGRASLFRYQADMKQALLILILLLMSGCTPQNGGPGTGVSKELAERRFQNISSVKYSLEFSIPNHIDSSVKGVATIKFSLNRVETIYLDFLHDSLNPVSALIVNGKEIFPEIIDEHLTIKRRYLKRGENTLYAKFTASDQSLNRREDLLYTLLVPDRARTLFPCFDQPDIKAVYELSLRLPEGWVAMSNSYGEKREAGVVKFSPTEPLPTYLFSFVAGIFNEHKVNSGGRSITIFHRESLPFRVAQCDTIGAQIFSSLKWLEDYTGIPYPFSKYDIAIIPGFQYGGMEHAGATLYADRTLFTGERPTTAERFARAKLIAHETAHMWFGDLVTMKWFDDVWTKEVFANWFAARMVAPLFPDIDHKLAFTDSYFPPAYDEDRTAGANSIHQPLDNLENAGLIYGNIIYNKAPIVMDMMVEMIGEEAFRKGIQEYLQRYAYSNATWDNLVEILDGYTVEDLKSWSDVWIKERGRPEIILKLSDSGGVSVEQRDPFERGLEWRQSMLNIPSEDGVIYPNVDGRAYGLFITDSSNIEMLLQRISDCAPVTRGSLLTTLFENALAGILLPERFSDGICEMLQLEEDKLIFSRAVSYLSRINTLYLFNSESSGRAADCLWNIAMSDRREEFRITAIRSLTRFAWGEIWSERICDLLINSSKYPGLNFSERDLMNIAYEAAIRNPELYSQIKMVTLSRLTGEDRKEEFNFIYPAASPDKAVRDSVFRALLKSEGRDVEPWATSALGFLCHTSRQEEAVDYIAPALSILPEIQKTGDIFFPRNWLQALLTGQRGDHASELITNYLNQAEIHPLLKGKLLQQSDHIINPKFKK